MSKSYSKTRVLVECALMVAIGTVLANIKIFTMPNGGSVTLLSMLPFVLVSFRHGVKWGLFTGLVNGCRNDGFFGRFQQLGNSGDEFFVVAKYRIACCHVCGGVFARNSFWRTVGKRMAGNPPVDFF